MLSVRENKYLETYREIDLALDTFPYNGHTTSLDALGMGVPVVTRWGRSVVGRSGLSQLARGLPNSPLPPTNSPFSLPLNWLTTRVGLQRYVRACGRA
ncbi:hypothetical protein [Paraburkholderia sp. SUR17]|uniref:hypothetical protein n=1 Tax=Paraburkholderia sp. SUR17 TaxID=3034358 RepID=UPI002407B109|nr:hypothetical protein [Paraburkholderia sp. SUR17]WEY39609.1 hypothetical protein P2869_04345 [Paraburkholderia sp. SUR17]